MCENTYWRAKSLQLIRNYYVALAMITRINTVYCRFFFFFKRKSILNPPPSSLPIPSLIVGSYIYMFTCSRDSLLKCKRKSFPGLLGCLLPRSLPEQQVALEGSPFLDWACNDLLVMLFLFSMTPGATHYRSFHLQKEEISACSPWWIDYKSPIPLILTGSWQPES